MNEASSSLEKTEVLYDNDNIQRRVLEAYSEIKEQHESCIDHTEVAMVVTYDAIWNGLLNLKKRGIRMSGQAYSLISCLPSIVVDFYCQR